MINRSFSCKTKDSSLRALVLRSALCSLLTILFCVSSVSATEPFLELTCEGSTLTINARDIPAASVLKEIARQRALNVQGMENARGVFTGQLRDISLSDLLQKLLTDHDYTLIEALDEKGGAASASLTINFKAGKTGGTGLSEDTLSMLQQINTLMPDQRKRLLLQAVLDRDPFVRELAYQRLYEMDEKELSDILIRDSRDPDPDIRRVSVSALGEFFGSPSMDILREATEDPNPDVRIAAFQGLSQLPLQEGIETIRSRLSHPDPEIRLLAIETMTSFGEREAKEAALSAIRDDDDMVRGRAEGLLAEIAASEGK